MTEQMMQRFLQKLESIKTLGGCSKIDFASGTPYMKVSRKLNQFVTRKLSQNLFKNYKKKGKADLDVALILQPQNPSKLKLNFVPNGSEALLKRALSASNLQLHFQDACNRCGTHLQRPATNPF